jgi:hypothetical protein
MAFSRRITRLGAAAALLACAGCGGGLFLNVGGSFGDGFDDGNGPDVNLASAATSASPGQTVHLVAAASDDVGIDSVAFYRADLQSDTLLGSDGNAPYEWDAQIPGGAAGGAVQFFAIATDVAGNRSRSASVVINVVSP